MGLRGKLWRSYVRNPDLQRAHSALTHPTSVLTDPVPHCHAQMLHVTLRPGQGEQPQLVIQESNMQACQKAIADGPSLQRYSRVTRHRGHCTSHRRPGRPTDATVQRDERCTCQFSDRDVTGFVSRQVAAEFPHPRTEKRLRPLLDRQVEQITMSLHRLIGTDDSGHFLSANDVTYFKHHQLRCEQASAGQLPNRPATVRTVVEQQATNAMDSAPAAS